MVKLTEAQINVIRKHDRIFKSVRFGSVFTRNIQGHASPVRKATFEALLSSGSFLLSESDGTTEIYRITDAGRAALERSEG